MKTNMLLRGITLAGITCIIFSNFSCNSNPSGNTSTHSAIKTAGAGPLLSLPKEDTLILTGDTVQPVSANKDFDLMNNSLYISIGGTLTAIDSLNDVIDTMFIRRLYDSAYSRNTGGHFVTALQIQYGIHNHALRLYYKPLCLTRDSVNSGGTTEYGYYSNHNKFDSNYYTYSGSMGFTRAPYTHQFLVDSTNYVDSIRIRL